MENNATAIPLLEEVFNCAAEHFPSLTAGLSQDQLLYFYARYKQASEGVCTVTKPSMFQLNAKRKWQAWTQLGDMNKQQAMSEYVIALKTLDETWTPDNSKTTCSTWMRVSRIPKPEKIISENKEDLFLDAVREGNIDELQNFNIEEFNCYKFEDGMTALHWAADRGHCKVVQCLLDNGFSIDARDNSKQTALHYAASCGHINVVKVLLKNSADKLTEDEDCLVPRDVATDGQIIELLS